MRDQKTFQSSTSRDKAVLVAPLKVGSSTFGNFAETGGGGDDVLRDSMIMRHFSMAI